MIIGTDLAATIAALAGQDLPREKARDSLNLVPLLTAQPGARGHEVLMHYVEWGGAALRQGDWKLMLYGKDIHNVKPTKLFNLRENPTEDPAMDLINHPEQKQRIDAMYNTFLRLLKESSVAE